MFVFLWKTNLWFTMSQKIVIRKLELLMAERSSEVNQTNCTRPVKLRTAPGAEVQTVKGQAGTG